MSVETILSGAIAKQGELQQRAMDATMRISLAVVAVAERDTLEAIRQGDEIKAAIKGETDASIDNAGGASGGGG